MEKATISEIKNRLSAYLKKVKAGQSILILDRNQPVARLERGLIRRATQPVPVKALKTPVPKVKASVLESLVEERREER